VKDYLPTRMRRGKRRARSTGELKRERVLSGDDMMDFTPEELREFLEGDACDVEADPKFKERLRRKLWEMVRLQHGPNSRDRDH
jgi:hypothetical protein